MSLLLKIKGIKKTFGGLIAVNNISFNINEGEIVGLIGPNGAGKSTLLKIIAGKIRSTKGSIYYKGNDITNVNIWNRVSMGIVCVPQDNKNFQEMTVFESMLVASHKSEKGESPKNRIGIENRCRTILDYMDLLPFKNKLAMNLPHGNQRLLGIALCLATEPNLMLLDEPLSGMNPNEATRTMEKIIGLRKKGITIFVVEHNVKILVKYISKLVVMDFGEKIAEGIPEKVINNEKVIKSYLGKYEEGE